ncbi:leukocyte receptor cluster member 1 [Takifugu rubripes]|uniref:Leukocyte receptor cluster (LRC) member 1 n=1 Tax=Takifugu rubripes TaxID=31033 RepID=H2UTV5_TAKRU|nr:leukocyte receptor cluster member 1 [Takifugu rubripes]XP_011617114.1 leukocyte receptor cluster member 1 [Takifugu rubripes]XP_011617115.1 leukocyte receptor cluster member 1 [Takifugu rubripes]XP_011617116.1 leukocyte receptor cluster member 1 [Takifugu rubripes]XP_011617117.1 leukocyte receptor cluster member 1 [Takifugu rubripes]|eukprot:XP_003977687.1 PREDICTED: leukocyte receptor cluster member 1 [Takifugu rubripes]
MNILPKKSWHVRNKDNVARVRKDEAEAAEKEREAKRRVERAEQEARTEFLRRKARAALVDGKGDDVEATGGDAALEHLNLFPLEESSEKKGNEEYLKEKKEEKEKQERAIGLLVSLGPQPGTEITPWYLKTGKEKEEIKEKTKGAISEEEKEKKDRRLKDILDPLKDMKKAMGVRGTEGPKSKKPEKRQRKESSSGESSIERLRAERLQREAAERRRAQALIEQRNSKGKESGREVTDRDRPYNSAYFPELARKRQRRDRESWRDEILKS